MNEAKDSRHEYSRIKDAYLPIFNYYYYHQPSTDECEDENHLHRPKIYHAVYDLLTTTPFSGAYLIAGLRGSGKTSLIKKAIRDFKNRGWRVTNTFSLKKYRTIDVNF